MHHEEPETRVAELKLEIPPPSKPQGVYKPLFLLDNRMIFLSGHGPLKSDGTMIVGRVGADLDLAAGKLAARQVGLAMLATLQDYFGGLNHVRRLIKTFGLVNCTADFTQQSLVINGFSELMFDVFGPEHGIGVRSAVGAVSLPGNMAVEIEAIFEAR